MKILLDYEFIPVEIALDYLVSSLEDYTRKNEKAKDKERLNIALAEIKILENSIIKAVK